jgi:hypothetical protein
MSSAFVTFVALFELAASGFVSFLAFGHALLLLLLLLVLLVLLHLLVPPDSCLSTSNPVTTI